MALHFALERRDANQRIGLTGEFGQTNRTTCDITFAAHIGVTD